MKRGLVVSDLHVGSQFGIMPEVGVVENIVTGEEEEIKPNKGQEYLLERWNAMLDTVGRVDFCVVNGDCCDGPQKKSDGLYLRTTNLDAQVSWASSLLKQIKTKVFYVTLGSRYHIQEQQPLDRLVAEKIGAKKYGMDILQHLKDEDVRIHYCHYVGGTRSVWMYATSPIARDLVLLKLNEDVKRYGKVKLCVRSHRHWLVGSFFSRQIGIVTPGWQLTTPHWKRFGGITPPDIGWVTINVEDNGKVNLDWSAEYAQPICVFTSD